VTWRFPSVTRIGRSDWTAQLWRPEFFHFLEGGCICALLCLISSISCLVRFTCASRRFSAVIYHFFSCVIVPRVLQDNWRPSCDLRNFASSHGEKERRRLGPRIGKGVMEPRHPKTGSAQVISLRISMSLLSFETCFIRHPLHGGGAARTAARDDHSIPKCRRETPQRNSFSGEIGAQGRK